MFRRAFFVVLIILYVIQVNGQNKSYFYTVGFTKQKVSVDRRLSDSVDAEEYIDEGNVSIPSTDSMKVYMPMVALPLKQIYITSPFGMRYDPMDRSKRRFHSGIDLRAHYENVYSMLSGTVTATGYSKTGGNYITIDYGICSCSYLHLSKIKVKVRQYVRAGQFIGVSGNSGSRTTGEHLHISCRLNSSERKHFNPILILGFVSDQLLYNQQLK